MTAIHLLGTLTEAHLSGLGQLALVQAPVNSSDSTARRVPYSEIYRAATAELESPIDQIQKAAADEEARGEAAQPSQ